MFDTRQEILKSLRAGTAILRALVRDLEDGELRRRPAPGEWPIVEVVAHLADTEERALERVRRMLREDDPFLPAYDQAALATERRYLEMQLDAELERFASLRADHIAELERLDDLQWRRMGRHEEQGPMSVELYEAHVAGEDADHLAQIARLVLES